MARLRLSKSSLANELKSLRTYENFLPSLDLKRQQLIAERNTARKQVQENHTHLNDLLLAVGDELPMVANEDIDLRAMAKVTDVKVRYENIVGIHLPTVDQVTIDTRHYTMMSMPHWVDNLVDILKQMLELKVQTAINEQRLALLNQALKTITQRVNLFEKVLIPKTKANIKRIKIYLSDEQMAAVVRAKIAKQKRVQKVTL